MHANHAYVGAGLTATFTFNVAKVAPFCKPYAALIFINADGIGFRPCWATYLFFMRKNK